MIKRRIKRGFSSKFGPIDDCKRGLLVNVIESRCRALLDEIAKWDPEARGFGIFGGWIGGMGHTYFST